MRYGVALGALSTASLRAQYARRAQDAGLDSAWSSDNPGEDAIVHMSAMTVAAPGIHVGSGILRAFLRHPVTIASAFLTLQSASDRGVILGLASGTRRQNLYQYGIDVPRPVSRLRSVVGIVRGFVDACGRDEPFEWHDDYHSVAALRARAPDLVDPAPFPIWIAAVNERMQRFAGEVADGLCGHPVFSAGYLRDVVRPNVEAGRLAAGREAPFELAAWANTVVDEDKDRALHRAGMMIANYLSTRSYRGILEHYGIGDRFDAIRQACLVDRDLDRGSRLIPREVIDEVAVTGSPDEVRETLVTRYAGVADQVVAHFGGFASREQLLRSIDTVVAAPLG